MISIDDILYSPRVPLDKADALLALYDPSEELLVFDGPKLWFTIEPPGIIISANIQLANN
jgi:hypothetical protein